METTRPDVDAIKARWEASIKGEWIVCGAHNNDCSCGFVWSPEVDVLIHTPGTHDDADFICNTEFTKANAKFIANAHQDIPALLDYIERLESE